MLQYIYLSIFTIMRIILTFICIILSTCANSQNTFSYLGTLILSKNTPISFSLVLEEFNGIVNGDYDDLPEQAFYMVGSIDEAVEKAKTM